MVGQLLGFINVAQLINRNEINKIQKPVWKPGSDAIFLLDPNA